MRTAEPTAAEIVAATYNVHGFVSRRGRFDPAGTLHVIESLGADVVALQEVHRLPESIEAIETFAARKGYEAILGPTLQRGEGDFGNALLTRLPIETIERHDLSVADREPRGALDAKLRIDDTAVRFVSVHLGLDVAERRKQIARLADRLGTVGNSDEPALCVLLGDWNEWDRRGRRLAPLARLVGPFTRRATFPARIALLPLDRIAVRPAAALLEVRAVSTPAARVASDHLPLRARLRVPDHVHSPSEPARARS